MPELGDCGQDPIAALKRMFVDVVMGARIDRGQDPVLRPVFTKAHGVAAGRFEVRPDLPDDMRVGVFAGREYPAAVRFSSDIQPDQPDLRSTCGVGLKLFGVPGEKLPGPDAAATTHDFLLQNHDVFFVDTALDMCEFTQAALTRKPALERYLAEHPATARILDEMRKEVGSVLATDYWSVLPHRFGDRHAKYKLEPIDAEPVAPPAGAERDYLAADLRGRLAAGPASFRFLVQPRAPDMPLDAATVRWDEAASPPVHVATLTLPRQDVDAPGQAEYGENLSFTTWHALPEHAPVGSLAEARRVAYAEAAKLRRERNGVPLEEPAKPRPAGAAA